MNNSLQSLINKISENFIRKEIIKITLGNKRNKNAEIKNVFIKEILIKSEPILSFTYRYPTKDDIKNYDITSALVLIKKMLKDDFYNADVFTTQNDFYFSDNKSNNSKLITKSASQIVKPDALLHNKLKNRIVDAKLSTYLVELGVTTTDGIVKKEMLDKYKQINHFIQIIDDTIKDIPLEKEITVADMGSGKGYLTFALYDYLCNILHKTPTVVGIETREDLVAKCNDVAKRLNYKNLQFKKATIQKAVIENIDILIALHACDTATDDAIYMGIKANAKIIICAPCCHKQIRKQMLPANDLKNITMHGILLERQAEIVTDAIRALIMEAHGYKTKVFDFIATEHTPKNVIIVGIKQSIQKQNPNQYLEKVEGLKKLFNIETHYLQTLF